MTRNPGNGTLVRWTRIGAVHPACRCRQRHSSGQPQKRSQRSPSYQPAVGIRGRRSPYEKVLFTLESSPGFEPLSAEPAAIRLTSGLRHSFWVDFVTGISFRSGIALPDCLNKFFEGRFRSRSPRFKYRRGCYAETSRTRPIFTMLSINSPSSAEHCSGVTS